MALDLPGHGGSAPFSPSVFPSDLLLRYREVAAAFAEKLGLGRFVLVGHSMGGAIAQDLAVTYPERLAGLVLIGTGARLKVSSALLEMIQRSVDQVPRMMAQAGFSPASSRAQVAAWAAGLIQASAEQFWADLKACSTCDLRARVPEIECPVRILSGEDDLLTPPDLQEKLARLLNKPHLERISRAGHYMFWERPALVAELLLEGL